MVQETDALLVGGGDPLYLCSYLSERCVKPLKPDEGVWARLAAVAFPA